MNWTLEVVAVPVSDVDRAKAFYAEKLGFDLDHDTQDQRGVPRRAADPPGVGLLDSRRPRASWTCRQARSRACSWWSMTSARRGPGSSSGGAEVGEVQVIGASGPRPARDGEDLDNVGFVFFSDPDGNGWAVQQISARD
jgi:catechol 2,3-dioxygenase-like lactoylglutathione lyase family enzyme